MWLIFVSDKCMCGYVGFHPLSSTGDRKPPTFLVEWIFCPEDNLFSTYKGTHLGWLGLGFKLRPYLSILVRWMLRCDPLKSGGRPPNGQKQPKSRGKFWILASWPPFDLGTLLFTPYDHIWGLWASKPGFWRPWRAPEDSRLPGTIFELLCDKAKTTTSLQNSPGYPCESWWWRPTQTFHPWPRWGLGTTYTSWGAHLSVNWVKNWNFASPFWFCEVQNAWFWLMVHHTAPSCGILTNDTSF